VLSLVADVEGRAEDLLLWEAALEGGMGVLP